MSNENIERELGWDDVIEKESDFTLLPEGDYNFTVKTFERGRHPGSKKLPACNKAIVHIQIDSPEGSATLTHNLFLHTKTEGMLSAFFKSIGQKQHGEKLQMNWNLVPNSTGRCKVAIRKWTGDDGVERQSNEIKRFLEPSDAPGQQVPAASFTPGEF